MLRGIRAVYFDAVGTLIHPAPPAAQVYAEVGRRFGSVLSPKVIGERFRAGWAREEAFDLSHNCRTSEERELGRWRRIVAAVLDDVNDRDACFEALYQHFGRPDSWSCDPGTASMLECLHGRSYLLGIASNYDRRLRTVAAGKPELRYLTSLVISAEVGWRKPAPQFFAALGRTAEVSAETILYVGDDPVNDYFPAESAGLQALLLDRDNRWLGKVPRRIASLGAITSRPQSA
jgi:putative hydrolase of the HAD superfamily